MPEALGSITLETTDNARLSGSLDPPAIAICFARESYPEGIPIADHQGTEANLLHVT